MTDSALLRKDELETSLHNERKLIQAGKLKEDNPLDLSEGFKELCEASRRGDLKVCQEKIAEGVNINGRDLFDCTPLILPYAAHIASLLTRDHPRTSDIVVASADESFPLHKFILSARSPYFRKKLAHCPEATTWKLPSTLPPQAFSAGIKYLYFGEPPRDLRSGPGTGFTESEVLAGIDKIATQLELHSLMDTILDSGDRRLARQRRTDEVAKVKWDRDNTIFADVLLRADEDLIETPDANETLLDSKDEATSKGIPIGPVSQSRPIPQAKSPRRSVLYPAHRAMLIRSEFFLAMFSSAFREAQMSKYLQIIHVDCSPDVLEVVLDFLYTEKVDFPLDIAVDVLYAADLLMIERLKTKAAVIISTLGNGNLKKQERPLQTTENEPHTTTLEGTSGTNEQEEDEELIDIYEIIRAGWLTRVQRLEEFAARYLAYRLESHIGRPEFEQLVLESATRIQKRQETDSIELVDDIRYYLSDRFRLRFEDSGLDEMMEGGAETSITEFQDKMTMAQADASNSSSDVGASSLSSNALVPSSRGSEPSEDEAVDLCADVSTQSNRDVPAAPVFRTVDGEIAGDEFARDAMNYQILLNKLDRLLEKLNLDA
ncbi:predicted protein [Uncinocarpus reesii 1704]|uniref:BTB domain-containing protein n=1 Tax=Uncinocarpus reesii (strain UAMH 1704) TaxID=336963 RepID=C4JU38_UNCRE|nr:uncharacterized protein UREG_05977 [Uncinocarpus reesii 1704]EEP81135.1 predicted protein [Uncinocarpus reesii 1704]